MDQDDGLSPGNGELRRCLRDLVVVTALSSAWTGVSRAELTQGLADALSRLLDADFVGVRLHESVGRDRVEARCFGEGVTRDEAERIVGEAMEAWLARGAPVKPFSMENPCPEGTTRTVVAPIGFGGEFGVLAVGSGRPRFPTEEERLIIGIAANQAVLVLQHQRGDEAQALLSAIVESSEDAIVSKTLQGIITSWNASAERLFGYSAAEAVGQPITIIVPPERLDEERGILERLCRGERIQHFETVRRTKQGRRLDISLSISPVRDTAGRIIGASKVARDITAQKRAARHKDVFLAMLAHELRNPLAPIRNAVQFLRAKGPPDPELQWARDLIDRQTNHLTRLVDDLLDLSRFSRGTIGLRREPAELAAIVQSALDAGRPLIEASGHRLSVVLPQAPVRLSADPMRLAQALVNLLNNAAKYTDPGGDIRLSAEREGDEAVVRIRDSGIGIAPDMLEDIFEMFTQAAPSLERSHGGLGVGLTLVRQLVEMHGGTVEAFSEGPGTGSEFVVRLPVAVAAGAEAEAAGARGQSAPGREEGRLRVLVVDDNHDASQSLAILLRMKGSEVHLAHDGPEAVAMAETLRPDAAVLDIGLPTLDGYEAARRIRGQPGGDAMLLIALTGWGEEGDRRRSREAGFDHHLTKPVDIEVLASLLAGVRPRPAG